MVRQNESALYGQVVRTADASRVSIFCPELMYVEDVPLTGDGYILSCRMQPDVFRRRFSRSVLLSNVGIDLDSREYALSLLGAIPNPHKEKFKQFSEIDFWKYLRVYKITSKLPPIVEDESGVYEVFKSLGMSQRAVVSAFFAAGVPANVIFASVVTFLHKALHVEDMSGIHKTYAKDLKQFQARAKDVRRPLLDYLRSEREPSDLLYMLMRV